MKFLSVKSLNGGALTALLASFVLLILIAHLSSPSSGGPFSILIVFILVYIFFTSLFLLVTGVWSLASRKLLDKPALTERRRYYISSVLGFLPVLYLTLLSMGGVSFWGIILILAFISLMLFYVLRRSA